MHKKLSALLILLSLSLALTVGCAGVDAARQAGAGLRR
jgi:hypothetical protein